MHFGPWQTIYWWFRHLIGRVLFATVHDLTLMIDLTAADVADSTGALAVLEALKKRWPSVTHFFADGAYDRTALMDKAQMLDFVVQVVRRHEGQVGSPSAAQALDRGAHVRLDDPPASLGARL